MCPGQLRSINTKGAGSTKVGASFSTIFEVADSLFYFVHMETLQYFKDRPEDLETVGVSVGSRMALQETMKRLPFTDPLEAVKFVCKDIWQALFGKQADRLQMNRRFQLDVGLVDSASGS